MTKDEFTEALLKMKTKLYKRALSLTKNPDNAEDLVQETICKALSSFHLYKEDTHLTGWFMIIMRNEFINSYRRKRNIRKINDDYYTIRVQQVPDSKLESSESKLEVKVMNEAIETLPPALKEVFKLYVTGYKYDEIADITGLALGTVKSKIFHARKKLMIILK